MSVHCPLKSNTRLGMEEDPWLADHITPKRKRGGGWVPCFGTPKHAFEYESMAPDGPPVNARWVPCFGTPKHAFEDESMARGGHAVNARWVPCFRLRKHGTRRPPG